MLWQGPRMALCTTLREVLLDRAAEGVTGLPGLAWAQEGWESPPRDPRRVGRRRPGSFSGCGGNQGPWLSPSPRAPHAQQVPDTRALVCSHLLPSSLSQEPCPGSRGKVLPGLPPIPHQPPKGSRGHAQPALPCSPLLWDKAFQLWAPLSSGERSTGANAALGRPALRLEAGG